MKHSCRNLHRLDEALALASTSVKETADLGLPKGLEILPEDAAARLEGRKDWSMFAQLLPRDLADHLYSR